MDTIQLPETLPGLTLQRKNKLAPLQQIAYKHAYDSYLQSPSALKIDRKDKKLTYAKQHALFCVASSQLNVILEEMGIKDEGSRIVETPILSHLPRQNYEGDPVTEVAFVTKTIDLSFANSLKQIGVRLKIYGEQNKLNIRSTPLDLIIYDEDMGAYNSTHFLGIRSKHRCKL